MKREWTKDLGVIAALVVLAVWVVFFISCLFDINTVKSFIFIADDLGGAGRYDLLMDYFNCIRDALNRGFTGAYSSIYAPLVNIAYTAIAAIVGYPIRLDYCEDFLQGTTIATASYVILTLVALIILVVAAISSARNCSRAHGVALAFIAVANVPMIYAILRGNNIVFAVAFLMVFFATKDSKSALWRHIGYLCFALSICMKIYPVLFGLILLRDKDKRPVLWSALYTAVLFFVPFLAYNGVGTLGELFANLQSTQSWMDTRGFGLTVGLTNTINVLLYTFVDPSASIAAPWTTVLNVVLVIVAIIGSLTLREQWKAVVLVGSVVVLIPGYSSTYNLVFMIPGLILFLNERAHGGMGVPVAGTDPHSTGWKRATIAYLVLLVLLMVPVPFGTFNALTYLPGVYRVSTSCVLESCALAITFAVFGVQGLMRGALRIHDRK